MMEVEVDGWTECEINEKSVVKMVFFFKAGWQAAVCSHAFTENRDTEQQEKRGRGREVDSAISAQAWSDETLRQDNEDGSALSHSTLVQSQANPKVSTS